MPAPVPRLTAVARLPSAQRMPLAIGLPLRNKGALAALLQQIYDPASPSYRRFLTPEQFAEQFGPTEQDYQALADFATGNGLTVTDKHPNRMILNVSGSVADIEKVFHVTIRTYQHPSESRMFYAPDVEPSLDCPVPVSDISGLSDFGRPHHNFLARPMGAGAKPISNGGSSPYGTYMGHDFRAAYAPGVTLNGAGQSLALVQFDGYLASDITTYENKASLPAVLLTNVLLDGFTGTPTGNGGEFEVSLDIEVAISMAPGLSKVVVYEGNPNNFIPNDVLNRIVSDNSSKQISCSWTWTGGPSKTTDQIFQQMAAQGQSFFVASGDVDSYKNGAVDSVSLYGYPAQSPYVTSVGGMVLAMTGSGGAYASETVWNTRTWDSSSSAYLGSSGGISTNYAIPSWQQGVNMAGNGGSTVYRNFPDVGMTADNVYVIAENGAEYTASGTSCAAPLWAGFMALVNQQATNYGLPSVGFLNPSIYAIGEGANFASNFHDTTVGDNTSPDLANPNGSTTQFYAAAGYDLCTGWGSPAGSNLINSLAVIPGDLRVTPSTGIISSGPAGGPFTPSNQVYVLTNTGASVVNWAVGKTSNWVNLSVNTGSLNAGSSTSVTVSLNATLLSPGSYSDTVVFTNITAGTSSARVVGLTVSLPRVYYFPLDSDPGWARQGQWAFGHPAGKGGTYGYPDPANGATGTNVFGVNLAGDYSSTVGGPYYLTAGPLNLAGRTNVTLKFQRWLNTYIQPYVYATIDISSNAATWVQIFSNGTTIITDSAWTNCQYNVSSVADNQTNVYVRWGYQIARFRPRIYSGWNIDDIEFLGASSAPAINVAPLGTPLQWLATYGLTNYSPAVEELNDPDGDGVPTWQEYVADTNPTNKNSFFHIVGLTNLPPWTVCFVSSTARLYALECSTNLVPSNSWFGVAGQSNIWGAGGTATLADTNAASPSMYRLRVQLPP